MMIDILRAKLIEIESIPDEQWQAKLNRRKREELSFHDKHRDRNASASLDQDTYEKLYGNRKYYAATQASTDYVNSWIAREAKDKIFLDYACGNGGNAILAAQSGAKLAIGLDISAVSVENAKARAHEEGVSDNTVFIQADAENTLLPDDCIDICICSGMLHHLDLSYAFPELRRILSPRGKLLAVEALDYNPAIKLYRAVTPAMRTEWEKAHILSLRDIDFARHFFDVGQIHYWHIASVLAPHMPAFASALQGLDNVLTRIPLVRLLAWIFTFELIKPAAND